MATRANSKQLYSHQTYYKDLLARIAATKQGDRIVLVTMVLDPTDSTITSVFQELYAACRRGVNVRVTLDAFSFLLSVTGTSLIPGPLVFFRNLPHRLPPPFRRILAALEILRSHGGQYTIINYPHRRFESPYGNRSHIKFAVINDYVYISGCNLAQSQQIDLAVGWQDTRIANWLVEQEQNIAQKGSVIKALGSHDLTLSVDANTSLLLDTGKKNQSLIFDTALELIATAKRFIYITCQFFPNNITARHLADAVMRGVKVTIVYNHPSQHQFPFNFLHYGVVIHEKYLRSVDLFSHQLPRSHPYLHAKLLATDKGTLIGSHNYVQAGVTLGTAELAMFSSDPTLATQAIETLHPFI